MQLFFELASAFVLTIAGVLLLQFLLGYCIRVPLKDRVFSARREKPLYRPEIGHLYGFALLAAITAVLIGYLFAGNPVYGLPAIPVLSLLSLPIVSFQRGQRRFRAERSALNFLHGLHGLTQGGISLPMAVHYLSVHERNEFESTLQRKLKGFSKGRSIREILAEVRLALDLKTVNHCLCALELAYERGLPLTPILNDALPGIEAEAEMFKKIGNLRKSVAVQAVMAAAIPWLILGVLFFFQPDVVAGALMQPYTAVSVGLAIIWSGVGVALLWKISEFY